MKTENAIKKLKKYGFDIKQNDNHISGWKGEHRIGFYLQNDRITCISSDCDYARKTRDPHTDYFPETYHDNITQAIDFVERQIARTAIKKEA